MISSEVYFYTAFTIISLGGLTYFGAWMIKESDNGRYCDPKYRWDKTGLGLGIFLLIMVIVIIVGIVISD